MPGLFGFSCVELALHGSVVRLRVCIDLLMTLVDSVQMIYVRGSFRTVS